MLARLVGYTRNVAADESEIGEFAVVELRKFPYALVSCRQLRRNLITLLINMITPFNFGRVLRARISSTISICK
jgi:hypothetical protein